MPTDTTDRFPALVIGSGLAGLSAAAHLAGRGVPPLLLEADTLWPGGRLSGGEPLRFVHDGREWAFPDEHSVHALWGNYVNMRALLERFTAIDLQLSDGEEWINRWGREVRRIEAGNAIRSRWIPAPFHYLQLLFHPQIWSTITPLDFLSLPGFLASMLLTVGTDPLKEQLRWEGLTMRDYFLGWTPNLRATFEGLGVNLLAAPKDDLPLSAYVAALRFYTMLRRDSWQLRYFPADAHSTLIESLLDHIAGAGGALYSGVTAQKLHWQGDHWRVVVEDSLRGGLRSLQAEHVILAVDAPAAQRLLCASADTAEAAATIRFPDAVNSGVVRLWFSAEPESGAMGGMMTGDFLPDNFFWLHRIYGEYRAWHESTGGSAIELHYYEKALLDLPDEALIVKSVTEVQRAFPRLRGHFVHGALRRNSKVHTLFTVPDATSLHVQTPWQNVYACGDWVGAETPALWMERATLTGILAANHVLQALGAEPYPVLSPPPPGVLVRGLSGLVRGGRWLLTPAIRGLARRRKRKSTQ